MNTNSHIDIDTCHLSHQSEIRTVRMIRITQVVILRDGVNHVNAQLHAAVGMVGPGLWDPAHAVVAVTQQLDTQTVMLIGKFVKPGE